MKTQKRQDAIIAYHGTDRIGFDRFDIAEARVYNVGLHFGTKSAAASRIAYLREESPSADCRILTCELTLENPLRIDDVFGHSYAGLFEVLEHEIDKAVEQSVDWPKFRDDATALLEHYGCKYYIKEDLRKAS